MRNYECW